jgi:PIN domain nuclease of toxin-antitoxin system
MKLLLDTNALIWWCEDNPKLGSRARALIADPQNQVMTSIVSIWEISLKWRVGKMHLLGSDVAEQLEEEGISILPLTPVHFKSLESLEFHHGDPFDHLILAQAQVEGAVVMTSDAIMQEYGVRCVGIR